MLSISIASGVRILRAGARNRAVGAWSEASGLGHRLTDSSEIDNSRALLAGESISKQWAEAFADSGDSNLAFRDISPAVERTALSEAVHAFSDEIRYQDIEIAKDGRTVEEMWSAYTDACPRCADLDGTYATLPDSLPDVPPLHPNCQCFIVSYIS